MSRRTDLLEQLLQSDKFGEEKDNEQRFLAATAELILTDLVNIALQGIENDIIVAESERDDEVLKFLRDVMDKIDNNDWKNNVLITIISNAGTRTFSLEAGGCQESLRAITAEFSG